jgi:hypothetical protein
MTANIELIPIIKNENLEITFLMIEKLIKITIIREMMPKIMIRYVTKKKCR